MSTVYYTWARTGGYEVSSRGDRRFSAMYAIMPDGRSLEKHYQCCVKGYDPGGHDWRLGKGKPPLDITIDLYEKYKNLWRIWAKHNPLLLQDLKFQMMLKNKTCLSDMFAHTNVNQARALSEILNETP